MIIRTHLNKVVDTLLDQSQKGVDVAVRDSGGEQLLVQLLLVYCQLEKTWKCEV